MKHLSLLSIAVAISLSVSQGVMAKKGQSNAQKNYQANTVTLQVDVNTTAELTEAEETNLAFMREEEKLARDVYIKLYDVWGSKIFNNISRSEQKHMDNVKVILDAYNLADPAPVDQGFFTDPELQEMYNTLIEQGDNSLIDALKVGALIEEVDIRDLNNALDETDNAAIIQMYTSLLNGSYNHIRAFVKQLNAKGETYEAQILTAEELETILGETNKNSGSKNKSKSKNKAKSKGKNKSGKGRR